MSAHFQVTPKEPLDRIDDGVADPAGEFASLADTPFHARLKAAYLAAFAEYQKALSDALSNPAFAEPERNQSAFPQLPVPLDDAPDTVVVFDGELFTTMFDLYAFFGWDAVNAVETALETAIGSKSVLVFNMDRGSPLPTAVAFFGVVRKLLALLVRDALIRIERLAATRVVERLSLSARLVSAAWLTTFKYERREMPMSDDDVAGTARYRMGNREASARLYEALKVAVEGRERVERLLRTLKETEERAERARRDTDRQGYEKFLAVAYLEGREKDLKALYAEAEALQGALKAKVFQEAPVGLLILDGLPPGFEPLQMEQLLGAALWTMYEAIDATANAVNPEHSLVAARLPGLDPQSAVTAIAVARLPLAWKAQIESDVVKAALDAEETSLALLHQPIWDELVESGAVEVGSFDYAVAFQYGRVLERRLTEQDEDRSFAQAFQKKATKGAAALSLVAFAGLVVTVVVPEAAPVARVLGSVSGIASLALTGLALKNVRDALALLDERIAEGLSRPDGLTIDALSNLGELARTRRELVEQLPREVVQELLTMGASKQWPLVLNALLLKGYYTDMRILVDDE